MIGLTIVTLTFYLPFWPWLLNPKKEKPGLDVKQFK